MCFSFVTYAVEELKAHDSGGLVSQVLSCHEQTIEGPVGPTQLAPGDYH